MGSESTPRESRLNRSGVPFQLAVERAIRALAGDAALLQVLTEVPGGDTEFVDIVAFKRRTIFVIECKKVEPDEWTRDRERTVFAMRPRALSRFFAGFRSFHYASLGTGQGWPPEYDNPSRRTTPLGQGL